MGQARTYMSRSDFVSVTIVTYNSGRFIKRCLESVLDQNYPFTEIIVVDNNSSDGLPLGAGAEEHTITAGVTRRISPHLRVNVKYAFFH